MMGRNHEVSGQQMKFDLSLDERWLARHLFNNVPRPLLFFVVPFRFCSFRFRQRSTISVHIFLRHLPVHDTQPLCAIRSTKISGHLGLKLNGPARSDRKSFENAGPPYEVDLFSWFAQSDRNWPFHLTFLTYSESQYLVVR